LTQPDGRVHERAAGHPRTPAPAQFAARKSAGTADTNNDGVLDLLVVQADGAIIRISDKNEGQSWDTAEIARVPNAANYLAGEVRLKVADLDNNGALDLIVSPTSEAPGQSAGGAMIWMGDEHEKFVLLNQPVAPALVLTPQT
jgi:hypothetical protein